MAYFKSVSMLARTIPEYLISLLFRKAHQEDVRGGQGGSETSNVVRVGDGGTDEKTRGGDGGGRVEDVTSD